jgi:hypothetical protein
VIKGSKCRQCMEAIKMKNHVMINASLCLLNDHSKDVVFTFFFFVNWVKIRIDRKRKMAMEEKH